MQTATNQLLSLAERPIGRAAAETDISHYVDQWGLRGKELATLLSKINGFYAFNKALLIRPFAADGVPLDLKTWNAGTLWKENYNDNLQNILFFAEDAFGCQFCIQNDLVCTFDPETGSVETMCDSVDDWAKSVLADREFRTGEPLAQSWQVKHGPLGDGLRLLPKMPFVCGGKYEQENLYAINDVEGMIFRSTIANQIRNLPDGAEIVFKLPIG